MRLLALTVAAGLQGTLAGIAADAGGRVGVTAVLVETGERVSLSGGDAFPMQSVFKLPVAAQLLHLVDEGKVALADTVQLGPEDMRRGRSPIRDRWPGGVTLSVEELLRFMLVESDNSAADALLARAGGPAAVTARLRALGVDGVRVDRSEGELARDLLDGGPGAMDRYVADPRDTATPNGMADLLVAIARGQELQPPTHARLVALMQATLTAPKRIRGLLPAGTVVGDRTGTGPDQGGINACTNDVGIVRLPDGRQVALAVFSKASPRDQEVRERTIARLARAVYDHWAAPAEAHSSRTASRGGLTKDQYLSQMGHALDGMGANERSASAAPGRVQIHANLFLAHETFIANTPLETLKRAVDAFQEAGVRQVDLNMGLFPWVDGDQPTIEKYDAVVARIRGAGMRVAVNPQYSPLRHRVKGFDDWRPQMLKVYGEIAGRYQPDVFVVVHEPTTMAARMGAQGTSPSQWSDFAREATRIVKERSPKSRIGAGGLSTEKEYFDAFAGMKEIDVLTMDVYNLKSLPIYEEMARTAKKNGKGFYIEETWRPPYFKPEPGMSLDQVSVKSVGDAAFAPIDVKWMRMMVAWSARHGAEGITPVWMQTFFAYGGDDTEAFDAQYLRQVMSAIDQGERTATFKALRELSR